MKRSKNNIPPKNNPIKDNTMNTQVSNYTNANAMAQGNNGTKPVSVDIKELSMQMLNEEQQLLLETQKQLLALLNMSPEDIDKL